MKWEVYRWREGTRQRKMSNNLIEKCVGDWMNECVHGIPNHSMREVRLREREIWIPFENVTIWQWLRFALFTRWINFVDNKSSDISIHTTSCLHSPYTKRNPQKIAQMQIICFILSESFNFVSIVMASAGLRCSLYHHSSPMAHVRPTES